MAKPTSSVVLSTSLSPVVHGVLGALAKREDPAHAEANGVITRLVREELERLLPGAWDELVERFSARPCANPEDETPRDISVLVAGEVGRILRARAQR